MKSLISTLVLTLTILNIYAQNSLKVDAGADINHCLGEYTELHASISGGVEPYQITWSPDIEMSSADIENPTVSPTVPTVYRVQVTDATGAVAKDEVKVKVFPKPDVITNTNVTIQSGESIALSAEAQGGSAPYTYSWKPNTGLSGNNSATPTVSPKCNTVYNVTVKDSKGCTSTAQVAVTVSNSSLGSVTGHR
jgi:hypothetical protein